jgi:Tfp pilus assembly protein PilX
VLDQSVKVKTPATTAPKYVRQVVAQTVALRNTFGESQMNHYSSQRGASLIVVMVMLLVITIIGTIAVRQSLVSLNIATNGQAQQLLMQNSDAAFYNVEKVNLVQSLTASGMFGYINGAVNKDKEMVFCFRGAESDFLTLIVPV